MQRATEAALLGQTYARLPLNVAMTVAAALAFSALLRPFFPGALLLQWLVVVLAISAARYVLARAWSKARPSAADTPRWRVLMTVSAWFSGGSWAFGAVSLMPEAGRPETMLLVLGLLAVSAVAVATLATQRAATLAFLLSALAPTALMLFAVGGDVERIAGLAMLASLACLILAGRGSSVNAEAQARASIELTGALAEARALAVERDVLARAQASERERLASILECTDAGVGEWHVDTGAMVFNERWAASLGYTLEEMQPLRVDRWMAMCHPDDQPQVEDVVKRHFSGQAGRCDLEMRMRHRDGHWVWFQVRGRLSRRGPNGEPLQMTGLHIDISERKLSEQRWQARAELSADGFWETDEQHRVRLWQAGVLNRLPVEADRLLGRRMDEVPGISAAPEVWPEFMHRLTTHLPFRGTIFRVKAPDGSLHWIETDGRPRFGADGVFAGYEGVARDVTDRQRVLASLQESLSLVDKLFETIPIPVVLKDPQGRYVRLNRAYEELFGQPGHSLIGRRIEEQTDDAAAERHRQVDEELMARPGQHRYELHQRLANGRFIDTLVCKATLVRADGGIGGLIGAVVDITEQKAVARALQQATTAAEAANRAKSSFLATMSHELRTPLNAVIGAAQLLRAEHIDAEQQAHLVDAIQRGGTNLLGLIENILDLSRIEAGQLTLHTVDFDLVDCVEAALSTAAIAAHGKGLRLACIVEPGLPARRRGDVARLRQVVLNLLGNAVKFTDVGEVIVRVGSGGLDRKEGDPGDPGDSARHSVRISVEDSGVGMDEGTVQHIFEPFRQAEDQANRRFGGSGLGLAIVRQLMAAMAGRVDVVSSLGKGSCFSLELPLPPAELALAEPEPLRQRVAFHEPHEPSAQALRSHLLRLGCQVQRCDTPAALQAWAQATSGDPGGWLLVAADAPDGQAFVEQSMDLVDSERLVVMADDTAHEADQAREALRLSRQIIRPVTRAALLARLSQAAGAAPPSPSATPSIGTSTHVLVVEDDELNRSIVCGLLRHAGCHVSAVADGHAALRTMAERRDVDLVLMDWQMPDIDGLEVTRRLRAGQAGEAGRTVPIVALTANAFAEDRDACLAVGMNDFLTKPVLAHQLLSAVATWTTSPAAGRQPQAVPALPAALRGDRGTVFDASVLAALPMVADGSQPDMVKSLLALFDGSTVRLLAEVGQAVRRPEGAATLQRLMHTLKSSAASVGALELAALAERHETRLRSGAPPDEGLPERLASAFERLRQAVQRPAA